MNKCESTVFTCFFLSCFCCRGSPETQKKQNDIKTISVGSSYSVIPESQEQCFDFANAETCFSTELFVQFFRQFLS